ncbi:hypothetical protein [Rickettsiella endosymbiont of Rhagonycha lignosa]|uniref:hypothetical protein n=1 Tax=Rickettsiella endosymbiont of Rhagonycha lignosa TaxID=3077937 RepID=UPI00313C6E98
MARNHSLLAKDSFYPTQSGITKVTAHTDLHTSLFALNFCIKGLSKPKKIYVNKDKTKKINKIHKLEERFKSK